MPKMCHIKNLATENIVGKRAIDEWTVSVNERLLILDANNKCERNVIRYSPLITYATHKEALKQRAEQEGKTLRKAIGKKQKNYQKISAEEINSKQRAEEMLKMSEIVSKLYGKKSSRNQLRSENLSRIDFEHICNWILFMLRPGIL